MPREVRKEIGKATSAATTEEVEEVKEKEQDKGAEQGDYVSNIQFEKVFGKMVLMMPVVHSDDGTFRKHHRIEL